MPDKRKDTERKTFYLKDETVKALDNYVSMNYSINDGYGVYSQVADAAISCFCSNMNNKSSCGTDSSLVDVNMINRIIGEHIETLDKLAEEDNKE